MKRWQWLVLVPIAGVLSLAACGGEPGSAVGTRSNVGVAERIVTLSDGRTVTCITIQNRGISCDFAGATP